MSAPLFVNKFNITAAGYTVNEQGGKLRYNDVSYITFDFAMLSTPNLFLWYPLFEEAGR